MRNCHLFIGGLGLILFALQGQYMQWIIGVADLPDGPRMMYRSAHIYFLLASVANVTIGYFMTPSLGLNHLQRLCSVLLLISGPLLIWSFFTESTDVTLERPIAKAVLYSVFGAAALLVTDELYRRIKQR
jgi:hypothetical protein